MIWKATLTTSVSSISLRTTLSKSIDHRAQCFYLKKQQQQQPAATLQYSQKTFLVRTNWGPKRRKKNLETAPALFLKVWMTAPSLPPPLPRPLSPAPLSGTEKYCYRMIARDNDFVQPTLEAVVSYNHLIRHLSRWERKGWNSAWSSSLTHRGIQSERGGGGGGGGGQFVGDNFCQQNPAQKLLCERSLLRIYRDWFDGCKLFAQHFKLTSTSIRVLLS